MDEATWLTSADPQRMLFELERLGYGCGVGANKTPTFARKLRLFAVACQERFLPSRSEEYCKVVDTDGQADGFALHLLDFLQLASLWLDVRMVSGNQLLPKRNRERDQPVKAALLRDIFGNPFRPVWRAESVNPKDCSGYYTDLFDRDYYCLGVEIFTWEGGKVPQMARHIYAERAFDLMPMLADLLESAGCGNVDILAHCRSGGTHVRGCWVLDLLTGRV